MNKVLRIDCYTIIANTTDFTGLTATTTKVTFPQMLSVPYNPPELHRELTEWQIHLEPRACGLFLSSQ